MYDVETEYENGVLVCNIHRTPISKSHGRFFCLKCQRSQDKRGIGEIQSNRAADLLEENKRLRLALEAYGQHYNYCDSYHQDRNTIGMGLTKRKCNCGLDKALK